jgi:hypothetical protein
MQPEIEMFHSALDSNSFMIGLTSSLMCLWQMSFVKFLSTWSWIMHVMLQARRCMLLLHKFTLATHDGDCLPTLANLARAVSRLLQSFGGRISQNLLALL